MQSDEQVAVEVWVADVNLHITYSESIETSDGAAALLRGALEPPEASDWRLQSWQ